MATKSHRRIDSSSQRTSPLGIAAGVLALLGLSTAALAASSPPSGSAAGASPPVVQVGAVSADDEVVLLDRQQDVADLLGFPRGPNHKTRHVTDQNVGNDFDEVVESNNAGNALSRIRFDSHGRLSNAVRLDLDFASPPRSPKIDRGAALDIVNGLVQSLSMRAAGAALDAAADDTGGWAFEWPRLKDGVPVRGDGSQVRLLPDGRPWAVSETFHDLADGPEVVMPSARASAIVEQIMRGSDVDMDQMDVQDPTLMWVLPNNWWAGAQELVTGSTARLAWVVSVETSGDMADQIRLVVLFVDAGDGTILGGDSIT